MKKLLIITLCIFYPLFAHAIEWESYEFELNSPKDIWKESTLEFQNKAISYHDLYRKIGDKDVDRDELFRVVRDELSRLIKETKTSLHDADPNKRLRRNELLKKIGPLVQFLGCCHGGLEEYLSDLRSIGYPLSQYDVDHQNYNHFDRAISNDDLIDITREYPDTEYEKEALYRIIKETYLFELFGHIGRPRLKVLIEIAQATHMYLEKYPNDERSGDFGEIFENAKQVYNDTEEDDYEDEFYENHRRGIRENYYDFLLMDRLPDTIPQNFYKRPYTVKKIPFEEILMYPLGKFPLVETAFTDLGATDLHYPDALRGKSEGWLHGYPDGSLRPLDKISRAEFLTLAIRALKKNVGEHDSVRNSVFPDVDYNAWYAPYIDFAFKEGVVSGYADGSFRPEATVTRIEALKILLELLGKEYVDTGEEIKEFRDLESGHWYSKYVYFMLYHLILDAYEDCDENGCKFVFFPDAELTRGSAVWWVANALDIAET